MRTMALTLAAAASIVGAVSLASNRAEATIPGSSAAIRQATEDTSLAHPANYVCRWSYWGRRCWWRPSYYHGYYGYHRPYYGYYGYHRPYYGYGYHRPYYGYYGYHRPYYHDDNEDED